MSAPEALVTSKAPPNPHGAMRLEMTAPKGWKPSSWDVRFAAANVGAPLGTGALFPIRIDITGTYSTNRMRTVLRDIDGNAVGVAIKMFSRRLGSMKIYSFEPVCPGQQASQKQKHDGKRLYAYGEVGFTGKVEELFGKYSTEYRMKTNVTGTPEYRLVLTASCDNLGGLHGKKIELSKDGRACGSAVHANTALSWLGSYTVEILPGIDPAAIITFVAIVEALLLK